MTTARNAVTTTGESSPKMDRSSSPNEGPPGLGDPSRAHYIITPAQYAVEKDSRLSGPAGRRMVRGERRYAAPHRAGGRRRDAGREMRYQPHRGGGSPASHADREQVIEMLKDAFDEGRLAKAELELG